MTCSEQVCSEKWKMKKYDVAALGTMDWLYEKRQNNPIFEANPGVRALQCAADASKAGGKTAFSS